jgi:hypothetical protein
MKNTSLVITTTHLFPPIPIYLIFCFLGFCCSTTSADQSSLLATQQLFTTKELTYANTLSASDFVKEVDWLERKIKVNRNSSLFFKNKDNRNRGLQILKPLPDIYDDSFQANNVKNARDEYDAYLKKGHAIDL